MGDDAYFGPFNFRWSGIKDTNLRVAAQIIQDGSGYRVATKDDFANITISGATVSVGSVGITGAGGTPVTVATASGSTAMAVYMPSGIKIEGGSSRIEGIRATGVSGSNLPQPVLGGAVITTGVSGTYTDGTLQNFQQDQYGNIWVSLGTALSSQVDSVMSLISGSGSSNQLKVDSEGRITIVPSITKYGITGTNGVAIAVDSLGRQTTLLGDPRFGISGSGTQNVASVDSEGRIKTLTSLTPVASGGLSTYRNINLTETGLSIKATPGQIYGWFITNRSASERFIRLFDTNTAPNNGVMTPIDTLVFPGSTAANVAFPNGITFVSGIGIAASTTLADNTSGAPSQNDVIVNIYYK